MSASARLVTFYSTVHHSHAPVVEYAHGALQPYAEQPDRADNILKALQKSELTTDVAVSHPLDISIVSATHTPALLRMLQDVASQSDDYVYPAVFAVRQQMLSIQNHVAAQVGYFSFDVWAPVGPATFQAASVSASVAYQAAIHLKSHPDRPVYALCRPPGHHAGPDYIGGYCYFNNAAIAARYLRDFGKVAILDIDYHHGNGTQDIFWNDPHVMFVSIHADPALEYPFVSGYRKDHDTADKTSVNIPLPLGTRYEAYRIALQEAFASIGEFAPDYLVVSAGFDTYKDDPIANFSLDIDDFRQIGDQIAGFNLPTLYVQEGGYAIHALGRLSVAFFEGVLSC